MPKCRYGVEDPHRRKFNGVIFTCAATMSTKSFAEKYAANRRKEGKYARVVRSIQKDVTTKRCRWAVYTRRKDS